MQQPTPRPRWLRQIEEFLRASPVTVLLGARQVGKTTLARRVAEGRGDTLAGLTLFVRVPRFALDEVGLNDQDRSFRAAGFPIRYP